jgi:hypothetical protein
MRAFYRAMTGFCLLGLGGGATGCDEEVPPPGPKWACRLDGAAPASAPQLGCQADYEALASVPTDASIPGATSVKTVIDRADGDALHFQNSKRFCIHWDFCAAELSGAGRPVVPDLATFNSTEYSSPDRRFVLGALSYYEGPKKWVYEVSPYDSADAGMIESAFDAIRENVWIGEELSFHPTSVTVETIAKDLPEDIPITSTDELFAGVSYQPLNPGRSTGLLRFRKAAEVDGTYTPFREIVVLDAVPNDISIVSGIITAEFQTPLAHINVLSVNRGTPNMALRDADALPDLLALEGQWVELEVGSFDWKIRAITEEEAEAWWQANKPTPLVAPPMDRTVTDLREVRAMIDESLPLGDAIAEAIPAFGAKATNYGALAVAQAAGVFDALPDVDGDGPVAPGFGLPMAYYEQFMIDNGLYTRMEELMGDPAWSDPVHRATALEDFKDELRDGTVRPELVAQVKARAAELFPGQNIRFRSSTNAEDLGTFTGAGLYGSETGKPSVADGEKDSVEWAMKKVWAQVWNPRAFEEREYYSIDHFDVGMAMLVHANFPDEESQGVAITNNPFDTSGLEPALFVNAQYGDNDVVSPDPGVVADSYLHYFQSPGQPIVYLSHSSLIPEGETVLTLDQSHRLAVALDGLHRFFAEAYAEPGSFYAMDVEWKFDDKLTPGAPQLFVKQARPFPGWQPQTSQACGGGGD